MLKGHAAVVGVMALNAIFVPELIHAATGDIVLLFKHIAAPFTRESMTGLVESRPDKLMLFRNIFPFVAAYRTFAGILTAEIGMLRKIIIIIQAAAIQANFIAMVFFIIDIFAIRKQYSIVVSYSRRYSVVAFFTVINDFRTLC